MKIQKWNDYHGLYVFENIYIPPPNCKKKSFLLPEMVLVTIPVWDFVTVQWIQRKPFGEKLQCCGFWMYYSPSEFAMGFVKRHNNLNKTKVALKLSQQSLSRQEE